MRDMLLCSVFAYDYIIRPLFRADGASSLNAAAWYVRAF